jgi:hypothetical protein
VDTNGPAEEDAPQGQQFSGVPDGRITPQDRTYLGKTIPDFFYGLNINSNFKGFDLAVLFQGVAGVQLYNDYRRESERLEGGGRNVFTTTQNRWTGPGTSNSMPRAIAGDPYQNNRFSDRWIENAGFFRLRNVQLGYSFPKTLMERTKAFSSARIYIAASNLFTITEYTGLDPEVMTQGSNADQLGGGGTGIRAGAGTDFANIPQPRTFQAGFPVSILIASLISATNSMKTHYKKITLAVLCLAIFTDCDKQLDLQPIGQLNNLTYYQNEKDFEAASLSPYSTLLNYYYDQGGLGWYQGVLFPDDDVTIPQNANNPREEFNWRANDEHFQYLWEQTYKGIMRANIIIDQLSKAQQFADENNKLRFEGEAKFLRAYFYFFLATNFGNVPIVTTPFADVSQTRVGNSQPGEVWDFIISDLQTAQRNLPVSFSGNNLGRATRGAATALLGKTYLYRAQWDGNRTYYTNAIAEFNKVVASGQYSLMPNFSDNFSPSTENNKESVFEIQFSPGDGNPWLPTDFGSETNEALGSAGTARLIMWRPACGPSGNDACAPGANALGYGSVHVTRTLQNEFEPNDPRIPNTLYREGDDFNGTPYKAIWSVTGSTPAKYIKQEDLEFRFPLNRSINNDRIIRYADVLLMLAETELLGNNNVARAAELINQVRRRADPTSNILPDRPATATPDQMMDWLMHERRVELALEGHRYMDLVRWHRAGIINIKTDVDFGFGPATQNWNETYLLKPIPQRELDLNANLKQNNGY